MLTLYTNDLKKDDFAWMVGAFSTEQLYNFLTQEHSLFKAFYQSALETFFKRDDREARVHQEKLLKKYVREDFYSNDVAAEVIDVLVSLATKPNISESLKIQAMLLFAKLKSKDGHNQLTLSAQAITVYLKDPDRSVFDRDNYCNTLASFVSALSQEEVDNLVKSSISKIFILSHIMNIYIDIILGHCRIIATLLQDCDVSLQPKVFDLTLYLLSTASQDKDIVDFACQTITHITRQTPELRNRVINDLHALIKNNGQVVSAAAYRAIGQITPPEDLREREELLSSLFKASVDSLTRNIENNAICMAIAEFSQHCPHLKNQAYQELMNLTMFKTVERIDPTGTQIAIKKFCSHFPEFVSVCDDTPLPEAQTVIPPVASEEKKQSDIQILVAQFTEQAFAMMLPTNQMSKRVDNCI